MFTYVMLTGVFKEKNSMKLEKMVDKGLNDEVLTESSTAG